MSKRKAKQFVQKLDKLFYARTYSLRDAVAGPIPGREPTVDKAKLSRSIRSLQGMAEECLARKTWRREAKKHVRQKKQWHAKRGKGRGVEAKRDHFKAWYGKHIDYDNCVYVFWANRKCVYVGRTLKGKGRPHSHFSKFWFSSVTRLDVYATSRAREVAKLECLAIHRFKPTRNKTKAASARGAAKCPICKVQRSIKSDLRGMFSFRRSRRAKRRVRRRR